MCRTQGVRVLRAQDPTHADQSVLTEPAGLLIPPQLPQAATSRQIRGQRRGILSFVKDQQPPIPVPQCPQQPGQGHGHRSSDRRHTQRLGQLRLACHPHLGERSCPDRRRQPHCNDDVTGVSDPALPAVFNHGRYRAELLRVLASAHALAGDADTAVTLGHQAIDAITALHSPRAYQALRRLHTVLEPMRTSPGVAELRDRLSAT